MSKRGDGQKRGTTPAVKASCDVCKKPDDSRMVACDTCEQWYHFACVSVDSDVQERDWSCAKCLAAADPSGTSTQATTGGAVSKSSVNKQTDVSRDELLQKQLAVMQQRMMEFERMLKEKDDQRLKELRDQRKKYDQELKDTERRVLEQVQSQHRLIGSSKGGFVVNSDGNQPLQIRNGGSVASSIGNQPGQVIPSGGSAIRHPNPLLLLGSGSAASFFGNQPAKTAGSVPTTKAIGNQSLQWTQISDPKASSTGNPLPQILVQDVSQDDESLAQELKLLQEKQALENAHFEERSLLLQRHAKDDEGAAGGDATPSPQATESESNTSNVNRSDKLLAQQLKLLQEKQALEKQHFEERNQLLQRHTKNNRGNLGLNPLATVFQSNSSGSSSVLPLNQSQFSARQALCKELPIFSGNPEEWPLFVASYENSTRLCGYSDEENLLRLQRSLKGKALEAVRCRLLHPMNLPGVISTLKTLFGRPEIIIHSLVNKIREMPAPKADKLNTLIDFGVAVQNTCAAITASGLDEYLCNVALLQELTEKLPPSIRLNWAYHRQQLIGVTLSDFGDWLGKLVEAASIVTIPSITVSKPERRGRKEDNYVNVHTDGYPDKAVASKDRPVTIPKGCIVCSDECSGVETCQKFLQMDVSSRWTVVKEQRLCRKCLRKHFGAEKICAGT